MLRVGLTGGIGSGKSEVARRLAELGAVVVDADAIAREIVEPGQPALAEIRAEFGDAVMAPDGSLDRAALAAVVFSDAERLAALNAITHPRIAQRSAALIAAAPADAVVVYDMPLLVENGLTDGWDLVVVVDCPDEARVDRLVRDRGMDPDDARARIAAQATREQRLAAADVVLDNAGTRDALRAQVDALWARLVRTASP
ncbi:MAG: dephospho-CoA kinase [Candidatus Nanopelagicales bacterium]